METAKERMSEIRDRMQALLKEYRAAENPPVFALRDEALEHLKPRYRRSTSWYIHNIATAMV